MTKKRLMELMESGMLKIDAGFQDIGDLDIGSDEWKARPAAPEQIEADAVVLTKGMRKISALLEAVAAEIEHESHLAEGTKP